MRDAIHRYTYMSKWERARSDAEIKRLQNQTTANRKRNMKPNPDTKAKKRNLNVTKTVHLHC